VSLPGSGEIRSRFRDLGYANELPEANLHLPCTATLYNRSCMSHSVKVTTPIPTPEEIAADLEITGNRLDGLLELVDGRKKGGGHNGSVAPHLSRVKKAAAKKASVKRTPCTEVHK
jgi:hypothetical protein